MTGAGRSSGSSDAKKRYRIYRRRETTLKAALIRRPARRLRGVRGARRRLVRDPARAGRRASSAATAPASRRCSSCSRGSSSRTGRIDRVDGRVSALLEVGAGFHPEYTAIENIYLSGAIYGIRASELAAARRRHHRLRRARALRRQPGEDVLQRHVRAARLLDRGQRRPRHPAGRRGAGRRRPELPGPLHRPHAGVSRRRQDAHARDPRPRAPSSRSASARSGSTRASCARTRCPTT